MAGVIGRLRWRASTAPLATFSTWAGEFTMRLHARALEAEGSLLRSCEGYPTGELKHGPNALLCDSVPLVVVATVDPALEASVVRYEKTVHLLRKMKTQGAKVIAVINTADRNVAALVSDYVEVQPESEYLLPIAEIVPLQLFAYFMAIEHSVDVDRPRNLSKAVLEE
jgi:glucosamine--fructose-6-phosphate aminotransferase (isomerizing)